MLEMYKNIKKCELPNFTYRWNLFDADSIILNKMSPLNSSIKHEGNDQQHDKPQGPQIKKRDITKDETSMKPFNVLWFILGADF